MNRSLAPKGRHADTDDIADAAFFARRAGSHRRSRFASRGSSTGWSGLASLVAAAKPVLDFVSSRSRTPLALMPLAAEDMIPLGPSPRSHPYTETPR